MRRKTMLMLFVISLAGACTWGTRVKSLALANTPGGANAFYELKGEELRALAEVYAADTAAVFLRDGRLRRIPWTRLAYLDFEALGQPYDVVRGVRPDSARLARIRLVSRFPQGLSGPLLAQVLVALKQDAVEEVP
jgi:hypothetical protein